MARDTLMKSAEDFRAELEQLREDMTALMKTVTRIADNGQRESIAKIKQAGTVASDQARQQIETAEKTIAQHPFVSVLIAFGTGLAIGRLIGK